MEELVKWGLFAAMAATVVALALGLFTFFKSGPDKSGKSNRMMQLRVLFQAIALAFFALLLYMRQG